MARRDGFTLIEVLILVLLTGILAVAAITAFSSSTNEARAAVTIQQLLQFKAALMGEDAGGPTGERFGFLGDLGAYPSAAVGIAGLLSYPATLNPWIIDTDAKFGSGWNGPYLAETDLLGTDLSTDGWGNSFVYSDATDPVTVSSLGADGAAGGTGLNSDITLVLPTSLKSASVHGLIQDSGAQWNGTAEVEINYPDGNTGAITQQTVNVAPGNFGAFKFTGIPAGERSVTIYLPSIAAYTRVHGPFLVRVNRPHVSVVLGTAANPLNLTP